MSVNFSAECHARTEYEREIKLLLSSIFLSFLSCKWSKRRCRRLTHTRLCLLFIFLSRAVSVVLVGFFLVFPPLSLYFDFAKFTLGFICYVRSNSERNKFRLRFVAQVMNMVL